MTIKIIIAGMSLISGFSFAKGLDDLTPEGQVPVETPQPAQTKPMKTPAPARVVPVEPSAAPAASPAAVQQIEIKEIAPAGGTPAEVNLEVKPEPKKERSATSKYLSDRLEIGTSVTWVQAKPSKGDHFNTSAASDFNIGLIVHEAPSRKFKTALSFRYSPIAGTWRVDNRDYNTSVEGYFFGAGVKYVVGPTTHVVFGGDLGLQTFQTSAQDKLETDDELETTEIAAGLHAGVNFTVLEKVNLGPVIRIGLGKLTTYQYGIAAGFVF